MPDEPKPETKGPDWVGPVAAVGEAIPGGKPVVAVIRAWFSTSKETRVKLLRLLGIIFLYPVYVFIAVMTLIALIPQAPKQWFQGLANGAFAIDERIDRRATQVVKDQRTELDAFNRIIDGASLMQFEVSPIETGDNIYIEQIALDKEVRFLTYQNQNSYLNTAAPHNCTPQNIKEVVHSQSVGQLIITGVGFTFKRQEDIPYSQDTLTRFLSFDKKMWEEIREKIDQADGGPSVNLRIQFQANPALSAKASACTRYSIFVVMNYTKRKAT